MPLKITSELCCKPVTKCVLLNKKKNSEKVLNYWKEWLQSLFWFPIRRNLIGTDDVAGLAAISIKGDGLGLAILDASTGHVWTMEHHGDERWSRLLDDLLRSNQKIDFLTKRC